MVLLDTALHGTELIQPHSLVCGRTTEPHILVGAEFNELHGIARGGVNAAGKIVVRGHLIEGWAYLYSQADGVEHDEYKHDVFESCGVHHIPELVLIRVLRDVSTLWPCLQGILHTLTLKKKHTHTMINTHKNTHTFRQTHSANTVLR